ncbi:MAG TPA: VWA domain-containing protein [Acidobacteriota bacterium]|nr:VWA domain-containing protein [Acidobacteriota bacterium]
MFFRFADPLWLMALAAIPLLLFWVFSRKKQTKTTLNYSHLGIIRKAQKHSYDWTRYLLLGLRLTAVALAIMALARPQSGLRGEEVKTEGIDIMLVIDVSSSMLAEDIEPNRVEAAKSVAADFVQGRLNDRIGLIIFSARAYTQCPLTIDYGVLVDLFDEIEVGMIEDGTAIGTALGLAVNRLRGSREASKVIVLLTDGRNNRGEIDPKTAAELAQAFDIKVYTIGAGKEGTAPYPVDDPLFGRRQVQIQVDMDETMLKEVAELTGGRYFRATNRQSLEQIYEEIDQLEKTEIEVTEFTRYAELFHIPQGFALIFLFLDVILTNTWLRRIP